MKNEFKRKMQKLRNKGFTLAELLIVVAIIAVLVVVSIPIFTSKLQAARVATTEANIRAAKAAAIADFMETAKIDKDDTNKILFGKIVPWKMYKVMASEDGKKYIMDSSTRCYGYNAQTNQLEKPSDSGPVQPQESGLYTFIKVKINENNGDIMTSPSISGSGSNREVSNAFARSDGTTADSSSGSEQGENGNGSESNNQGSPTAKGYYTITLLAGAGNGSATIDKTKVSVDAEGEDSVVIVQAFDGKDTFTHWEYNGEIEIVEYDLNSSILIFKPLSDVQIGPTFSSGGWSGGWSN